MEQISNKNIKMLLINETFIIDQSIHNDWFHRFTKDYIAVLKKSDLVQSVILSKIQGEYNPDGANYALQFKVKESVFSDFKNHIDLSKLRSEIDNEFKNKFGSFVTVLEIIEII